MQFVRLATSVCLVQEKVQAFEWHNNREYADSQPSKSPFVATMDTFLVLKDNFSVGKGSLLGLLGRVP